jgi:hypothetical protein
MKVLLLTYGNESSIEFVQSAAALSAHEVYGCHYDTINPGLAYLNKNYIFQCPNPFVNSTQFIKWLNNFVVINGIEKVFATNCKMLKFLYDNWDTIHHQNVYAIPDQEGLEPCLFKSKLYELLPEISPKVYTCYESAGDDVALFIKPSHGSSAVGARQARNSKELWNTLDANDVVTEYLPGDEFTIDCVSSPDGLLLDWNVRVRSRVRDGITAYGRSAPERWDELGSLVKVISKQLELPYFWFAQFKLDVHGKPKLLEVNCRISGSFCITKNSRKDYIKFVLSDYDPSTIVYGKPSSNFSIARHMNVLPVGRKSWVWDIDGTICTETGGNYQNCEPIHGAIETINRLYERGDEIVLHTARGMKRFNNDVAAVYQNLYDLTTTQLKRWGVKYDKLIMGKPYGTQVDIDALTPAQAKNYIENDR